MTSGRRTEASGRARWSHGGSLGWLPQQIGERIRGRFFFRVRRPVGREVHLFIRHLARRRVRGSGGRSATRLIRNRGGGVARLDLICRRLIPRGGFPRRRLSAGVLGFGGIRLAGLTGVVRGARRARRPDRFLRADRPRRVLLMLRPLWLSFSVARNRLGLGPIETCPPAAPLASSLVARGRSGWRGRVFGHRTSVSGATDNRAKKPPGHWKQCNDRTPARATRAPARRDTIQVRRRWDHFPRTRTHPRASARETAYTGVVSGAGPTSRAHRDAIIRRYASRTPGSVMWQEIFA